MPESGYLRFTPEEFATFLEAAKTGEFSLAR
jgi:hypothetical protein